jgi:hypothetical protein
MTINASHQRGAPKHFSIPFERIESLHPLLRFRVPLGDGVHELMVISHRHAKRVAREAREKEKAANA